MRTLQEIYAERQALQDEQDQINALRKPLVHLLVRKQITEEQDKELVRLTKLWAVRDKQLQALDWVCSAGDWNLRTYPALVSETDEAKVLNTENERAATTKR